MYEGMWALRALRWHLGEEDTDEIIALFTSKELAEQYLERAKLKSPTWGRKYKAKSLLASCRSAYIELYEPEEYRIDPEL